MSKYFVVLQITVREAMTGISVIGKYRLKSHLSEMLYIGV